MLYAAKLGSIPGITYGTLCLPRTEPGTPLGVPPKKKWESGEWFREGHMPCMCEVFGLIPGTKQTTA